VTDPDHPETGELPAQEAAALPVPRSALAGNPVSSAMPPTAGIGEQAPRRVRRRSTAEAARPRFAALGIAIGFGVLFAWDLVEAVANLLALLAFADAAGHPLNSYAWLVLGAAILVPPAAYTTALVLGYPRGPRKLAAALLAGLAATACLGLTLEALLRA
jgi:hypothetical protein